MKRVSINRGWESFIENFRHSFENLILSFFRTSNLRAHFKITYRKIREETTQHVSFLSSTLKKVVLPLSVCYLFAGFFLGNNVIDSLFLSLLIFVYSSFLPDLLSPFRIRKKKEKNKDVPWFKKYALLFLAPLFIFSLLGNSAPIFKTTEHFHNLKSLGAYGIFLFLLGLVFYGNMPLSWGRILEVFSLAIFGSIGYITHLKVDKIL
jgi:hypothetical protein